MFIRDAAGTELLRIFASDPNDGNWGSANLFIGYQAGMDNPTDNSTAGYYNTGIGYQALLRNTTGADNTAIGTYALRLNTTGKHNTAIGTYALYYNVTGSDNTAHGYSALDYNTSATSTTAIGSKAAQGTGSYSNQGGTYIGYQSGYSAATGSDYNTLLGYNSGYGVTTGARNVLLGHSTIAGSDNQVTSGSNNIAIGNDVAVPSATANNQLVIGNLIYGTGLSGTGATVSTGNIGIGTSTPWGKLSITGSGTGTGLAFAVADSANSPRFVIQDNGNVGIGTTSLPAILTVTGNQDLAAAYQPVNHHQIWVGPQNFIDTGGYLNTSSFNSTNVFTADVASTTQNMSGLLGWTRVSTSTAGSASSSGVSGYVTITNSSGTTGGGIGVDGAVYITGAGNQTNARGVTSFVYKGGAGTLANAVSFQAFGPSYSSGQITNAYGLKVDDFAGTASSTYSVYTASSAGSNDFAFYGAGTAKSYFGGNVGIGTSTPTAQLSTTGTVRFAGLGSGGANLVTDALGNVTASSDERLKDKQGDFTRGLAAINAISPVLYKWRPETGFDTQSTYAGFFAQNVQAAIPEAVSPDSRG